MAATCNYTTPVRTQVGRSVQLKVVIYSGEVRQLQRLSLKGVPIKRRSLLLIQRALIPEQLLRPAPTRTALVAPSLTLTRESL